MLINFLQQKCWNILENYYAFYNKKNNRWLFLSVLFSTLWIIIFFVVGFSLTATDTLSDHSIPQKWPWRFVWKPLLALLIFSGTVRPFFFSHFSPLSDHVNEIFVWNFCWSVLSFFFFRFFRPIFPKSFAYFGGKESSIQASPDQYQWQASMVCKKYIIKLFW